MRDLAKIGPADSIESVETIAKRTVDQPLRKENHNHLPGKDIRGIVGWTKSDGAIVAGPISSREETDRFLLARGLFHALCSCGESQRLVSQAYTWEQRASRGFAAELLAPQSALRDRTGLTSDWDTVEELATRYRVSSRVIELQLENADVELVS